jgi:hypothetical protein
MDERAMNEQEVTKMLINPYYAVNFDPSLIDEHPPIISEGDWIKANLKLMDEVGAQKWLEHLLAILQGAGPRNPDDLSSKEREGK